MTARYGSGRHRQPWLTAVCPCCEQDVRARRTLPGRPLHIQAHLTDAGVCPCHSLDEVLAS